MKNPIKIMAIAILGFAVVACTQEKKSDKAYEDYREYVMEHQNNADKYYEKKWDEIEAEYTEKQQRAEEKMENWNDQMRAEYETLKQDWQSYRESYVAEADRKEKEVSDKMLLGTLLPEGIREDMSNVNNSNIIEVHKHFVNSVEAQKDNMTREQWDKTEILWERLDTRKNELEKEMKSGVKMELAEQKLKYGAIKAVNRPVAKSEENAEAKEKDK